MNERDFKDGLFTEYARIGKCLSSPKRLEILDILIQGPKSVEVLSKMTSMSVANVSQHLQTLYQAKLVQSKKQGNFVYYELSDSSVLHFLNSLYDLSEKQLIEVQHIKEQFLGQFPDVEGVTMEELAMRMEKGEVTLLDVRPRDEYETAHIPGAVSVPIEELAEQLSLLPADSKIVAYCRGPYCLMAVRAIELLQAHGFKARHLDKSVHDWNDFILNEVTGS
ncbi:metalloregulator ArsR/SmtB family transcription factor [Paenibacillus polymyxa]|uniref:ArsR/SmtB family transcription factor n=1 Tax=Paenibacillus polymyxa TaxID=1406 RepID=UPI0002DF94D1|nr:metalloregulator ArsR/SmtB family transcription factor [Paenibacillus polymyxa]MBE7900667.1 metalloregulator ArsR/SmtB family transcription factor [Paenibacillus polymyxa]MBG9764903.1 ArsR family transcriptional regulator [Paenibacillus polymyxa]MCC3260889.1 metalloregulator ArsR/SmtB family transcription factor [Paenibacillus polymyxa]QPK52199.1 metalloregulator ArsR/SmtB family transcription factor [Paenibacillus polymyxa]QPK57285.1 metalloregulator ArsR/SmtB family transcription factor [